MTNNEMGNQQAKDTDLAWLAGIIDGEGSILLGSGGKRGQFPGYHGLQIRATIHITNTCANIISKCEEILDQLGVSFHVADKTTASNRTQVWRIDIGKMEHTQRLLEAIMPFLVSKIGQAKIVHRFVVRRQNRKAKGLSGAYDDDDIKIIDEYYNTYHGKRQPLKTLALPMSKEEYNTRRSKASTT